jgi:RNA polymerase primary sigma factor
MSDEASLEFYLQQIHSVPLLSEEREKELARRFIRENDPAAREELIRANLRLVVCLARKYAHRGLALSDLIEEGNLGLLKAVEAFNPEMNIRLSSYAAWWIQNALRRAVIDAARPIHIPAYMAEVIARWKKTLSELEDRLGRQPALDELAAHMQMSVRKARLIDRVVRALNHLSLTRVDEAGEDAIPEASDDERTRSPEKIALDQDDMRAIRGLFERIDQREAQVLRLRFGLEDNVPLTLREIGERVGLTRERVRQIENRALEKLNAFLSTGRIPSLNHQVVREDEVTETAAAPASAGHVEK